MTTTEKKQAVLEAYKKSLGNVTKSTSVVGISRTTFYKWKEKDKKFASQINEIDEVQIDFVESKLLEQIQNRDTTAIIFYLKTKGKKRGYVEQVDNNVTVNHFEELMKSLPDEPESM